MAQMNISVPDGLKAWVDRQVAEGNYLSLSDYVRDLLRRDKERHSRNAREGSEWLRAEIEHGLASGVSDRSLSDIHRDVRARREAA